MYKYERTRCMVLLAKWPHTTAIPEVWRCYWSSNFLSVRPSGVHYASSPLWGHYSNVVEAKHVWSTALCSQIFAAYKAVRIRAEICIISLRINAGVKWRYEVLRLLLWIAIILILNTDRILCSRIIFQWKLCTKTFGLLLKRSKTQVCIWVYWKWWPQVLMHHLPPKNPRWTFSKMHRPTMKVYAKLIPSSSSEQRWDES